MFSNSTQYALRTIVYMAKNKKEGKNTVVDLAEKLSIPQPYLSKVLQQLSRNGVISSSKGRGGGFYLSEEDIQRPLIDVIICMEGYNVFDKCVLGLNECSESNPCFLHPQFKAFKKSVEKSVKEQSVEDLFKLSH